MSEADDFLDEAERDAAEIVARHLASRVKDLREPHVDVPVVVESDVFEVKVTKKEDEPLSDDFKATGNQS
jgi:hypothetical protein